MAVSLVQKNDPSVWDLYIGEAQFLLQSNQSILIALKNLEESYFLFSCW